MMAPKEEEGARGVWRGGERRRLAHGPCPATCCMPGEICERGGE